MPQEQIVVRVKGGLGNQMFQYALGRKLALTWNAELLLDLDFFDLPPGEHTSRKFELDIFALRYQRASRHQIRRARHAGSTLRAVIHRLHPRLAPDRSWQDRQFSFDPTLAQATPNGSVYLDGYWQSEKYFADMADVIRADFSFRLPAHGANADWAARILSTRAVSVHVRRGDYVHQAAASQVFVNLDLEYYRRAGKFMLERCPDAQFFVFSDDPDWASSRLALDAPMHFVSHNVGTRDFEDMRLMSLCQHHVIANSSFSWWGAWLSRANSGYTVAPSDWFRDPAMDTKDLIPDRWIKL